MSDITDCPIELHLPFSNYIGPGTDLKKRLNEDLTPKPEFEPVDRVDELALKHDISYTIHDDRRNRHEADKEMIKELKNIKRPTWRERLERCIVIIIMGCKIIIDAFILWCINE
jgi:hypothetical protein